MINNDLSLTIFFKKLRIIFYSYFRLKLFLWANLTFAKNSIDSAFLIKFNIL